jgi:molybdopterin/thiamine biosynthesis adenylyltransferase
MRFVEYIQVIGCGGIGSWLLPPLLRFLSFEGFSGDIQFWDGDHYSVSNLSRQDADDSLIGKPKAEAQAERYRQAFPTLRIWQRNEYVTAENIHEAVFDSALVFSCVDNHPARTVIARQAEALRDVCVISAGNEKFDGNVCVTLRRSGKALTSSLLERHPEIARITRGDRSQMGCEELAASGETQLLVTNFMAAAAMMAAFHALWTSGQRTARRTGTVLPQEVFFDAAQCSMTTIPAAS